MEYRAITIGELKSFIKSDLYQNSKNIPITQQRALSQIQNPNASNKDIALIIAVKNKNIVGFIGALPEKLSEHPDLKLAWNSCWWIDHANGQETAIPLFLQFLKAWNGHVMFRDLTPKTEAILMRLKQFEKVKKLVGYRYFLKLNSTEILKNKNPNWKYLSTVLKGIDASFNKLLNFKNRAFKKTKSIQAISIKQMDNEAMNLIEKQNHKALFKKDKEHLNWMLQHPWVVKKSLKKPNQFYYFTDTATIFKTTFFKLYNAKKELIAVLYITNHNGLIKLPFVYFKTEELPKVVSFLYAYMFEEKAHSVFIINNDLNQYIQQHKNPFWHQKKQEKDFVIAKKLKAFLPNPFDFQDGEGDFGFT